MMQRASPRKRTTSVGAHHVIKAIGNNEERKRNHSMETQDFNVENPLQQREVKTKNHRRQPAKLHYIECVFINAVGYLMIR
jgi:hypothetical protein